MSWFSSIFSSHSILNPWNDLVNIAEGTKNLAINPGEQIHKYIEPAVLAAAPLALAAGATLLTGGLASPFLGAAIAGAAGTYGGEIATQGLGALTSGKPPSIGDYGIGATLAAGTYGVQSLLSSFSAPTIATSTSGNLLSSSGFNTAMANLGTTAGSTAGSTSWLGTLGSSLSSVGSTLSSGLSDTLGLLSTAAKTLAIAVCICDKVC